MLVGILAIIKAGCAYVPLDPAYPPARLNYMLEDSKAGCLISRKDLACKLSFSGQIIDPGNAELSDKGTNLPDAAVSSDLAYRRTNGFKRFY